MADYGLDGLSSTMSELHYGSRASSPGGSVLRDYRWTQLAQLVWKIDQQHLLFSRSQSPGMPAYMYSYIKQGRSVSSLRFHIVHVHDILSTNTYFVSSSRSDIS